MVIQACTWWRAPQNRQFHTWPQRVVRGEKRGFWHTSQGVQFEMDMKLGKFVEKNHPHMLTRLYCHLSSHAVASMLELQILYMAPNDRGARNRGYWHTCQSARSWMAIKLGRLE